MQCLSHDVFQQKNLYGLHVLHAANQKLERLTHRTIWQVKIMYKIRVGTGTYKERKSDRVLNMVGKK